MPTPPFPAQFERAQKVHVVRGYLDDEGVDVVRSMCGIVKQRNVVKALPVGVSVTCWKCQVTRWDGSRRLPKKLQRRKG